MPVRRAKVRDRGGAEAGERVRFTSAILPRWARRTKSLDALLPVLYLRGVSTGDVQEALSALLGKDAPNLSPSVIGRLKEEWAADYARWQRRDLSARRYVYIWADGVYLQARMEPVAECMMVIIGATPEGRKELVGFQVGVRASAQSWRELLVDIQARGLTIAPELAVADGALGFWKALEAVFPTTRQQRCWVHKTANVLNKVAKTVPPAMKQDLREIGMAPDRAAAETAMATFVKKYAITYAKAVVRWSPFPGQSDKLGSPIRKDGPDDGEQETVFGGVQGEGGAGGDPGRADGVAARGQARVHQTLINAWKKQAVEGMAGVFSGKAEAAEASHQDEVEKLHAMIGQLVVERDFLRKASGR